MILPFLYQRQRVYEKRRSLGSTGRRKGEEKKQSLPLLMFCNYQKGYDETELIVLKKFLSVTKTFLTAVTIFVQYLNIIV